MKKIHIKKISQINKEKLVEFYKKSFQFENGVIENFNWRYRLGFNDYEPIVLIIENEIKLFKPKKIFIIHNFFLLIKLTKIIP